MKKYMVLCAGLAVAFAFTSCKSSESAYRKAYEKAKAQETNTTVVTPGTETTVVAPVVTRPSTETVVVDNVRLTVSEPTLEPRLCAKCDLPRPCRDDSHISNICTVCLALDWSYEPRKKWRRYLIKSRLYL